MNIISRHSNHDDPDWWEEYPLMPGMYITVLRGTEKYPDTETPVGVAYGGLRPHPKVTSAIYPFTDIAYFVFSVQPGKGAMVKDLAHNNSYFIAENEIGDYELVENYMPEFNNLEYINEFLTGRFASDIAWFEKH